MGRRDRAVLAATVEELTHVVMVVDDDNSVVWRRRSERNRPSGVADVAVVGKRIIDRVHPDDLPAVLGALDQIRRGERQEAELSCRVFDVVDGTILHLVEVRVIDRRDDHGIRGILVLATVHQSVSAGRFEPRDENFSLADVAPVGLALVDDANRVLYSNQPFGRLTQLRSAAHLGGAVQPGLADLVDEARSSGRAERTFHVEGAAHLVVADLCDERGGFVVVSIDDITVEIALVEARVRSDQTWRATFEHTPAGIAVVGIDGRFIELNPAWLAITGFRADELIGRTFDDITHADDLLVGLDRMEELLRGDRDSFRLEKRYFHRTGRTLWADLWVSVVRDGDGAPLHFVSQILDITGAKQVEEDMRARHRQLTHDATHDHLTGLPNRALAEEHLRVAIDRASRRGDRTSVLLIDLDDFKMINDTWGHVCGDRVLVELSARLSSACRRGDIVARFGGDEFIAIADPIAEGDDGRDLAERLAIVIARPLSNDPGPDSIHASIGVAEARGTDTVETLITRADAAAYVAKASGGGSIAFDGDLDLRAPSESAGVRPQGGPGA